MTNKPRSCYGCIYYDHDFCKWFVINNKGKRKKIPKDVLSKGCKHQKPKYKQTSTSKLVAYVLKVFEGEII